MKKDFVTDFTDVRKFGNGLCRGFKGCNGLMLREEGSSATDYVADLTDLMEVF
ncbi:MAG: hypothetical protein WBA89_13675 [Microcoleus sp.]|uniref:hypothetical protein n=1 Tax=Microcoleus sp. TaxID=44472 RepID=UPI003C72730B